MHLQQGGSKNGPSAQLKTRMDVVLLTISKSICDPLVVRRAIEFDSKLIK